MGSFYSGYISLIPQETLKAGTWIEIGSIPVEHAPSIGTAFNVKQGATSNMIELAIGTDGIIKIRIMSSDIPAGSNWFFRNFEYFR